ncbi:MAG TPA: ATP-binding protein [Rhodanobacteraceae bacterium]|nr:ATP-binding protein [Rhodanobacteraceae bacterium]
MKTISDQEVIDHIKRLNGWWKEAEKPNPVIENLKPRAYLPAVYDLMAQSKVRRAVVLMGPRRVGKTILIHHLIDRLLRNGVQATRIAYIEVDNPLLHGQSLESLQQLMRKASGDEEEGTRYFFFDEVQYLKDWERHLKSLVDHQRDLRVLVSGSAAAALKRKSMESGAGRFTDFLLPPLTFPEYIELLDSERHVRLVDAVTYEVGDIDALNRQFVDYVNFGGYPELALSHEARRDPQRFVKSDIVDKVLLRDLPQLYGINDIQELNALFTLLAYNSAEEVSLEALSQRSGVGKPTISRYIEYLEAAFLLKRIFRVDQSGRRYQRDRKFKVYLTNPAMRTGLFGPVEADGSMFGHAVETALFAQRFHENARLHYARWGKHDMEVDMIELDAAFAPVMAMEIKWSDRMVEHKESLQGLLKFCAKSDIKSVWVTTRTQLGMLDVKGRDLPLWPSAVMAFHLGTRAVDRRLQTLEANLQQIQPG